jgi:hypothetical protein
MTNATGEPGLPRRTGPAYWPRWTTAGMMLAGAVIVVAETTSLLLFAGILLIAVGIYGALTRSRRRSLG